MDRVLIVPAAGRGSRLGADGPKALVPVAGRAMLDHLLDLHAPTADRVVVVVAPPALEAFAAFARTRHAPIDLAVQQQPTGMLDAIGAALPIVARYAPRRVAVTWCDQIAVRRETIARVAERASGGAALVFPTVTVDRPYIHFDRDARGRVVAVRQRREGDAMPDRGETDIGLFDLSLDACLGDLPAYAGRAAAGAATGERNFLPFIPWLAARRDVETVAGAVAIEAVGINTAEELAAVEAHLSRRPAAT